MLDQIIKLKIVGKRPLLMHSDVCIDPLNKEAKEIKVLTAKRKKTGDDHELIAKLQWQSALYFDEDLGPYLPGINIESCLIEGAKLSRLGTALKRSIEIVDERCALEYDGPRTRQALWDAGFYDARSVKVTTSRIMRYRPLFTKWSCNCDVVFNQEMIDRQQVIKSFQDAGAYIGVGDYRPKFGRFSVIER